MRQKSDPTGGVLVGKAAAVRAVAIEGKQCVNFPQEELLTLLTSPAAN